MTQDMPDKVLDVDKLFHNIDALLQYYRYAKAFCADAVDAMDWYIGGQAYRSEVQAIRSNRLQTMTIMAHIDTMMERYRDLCSLHGDDRRYSLIRLKYLDMDCAEFGRCVPTTEQLADWFDCDVRTVQRDIRLAKKELSILIFGDAKKNLKKSK